MKTEIHLIAFFDELLLDVLDWMQGDETLRAAAQSMQARISTPERMVPVADVETVSLAIPAYIRAHPGLGNVISHLRKYLETVLRDAA